MIPIPRDFRDFIDLLNEKQVRYLVIGGYAVAFHGYPRVTGDLDIFIEMSETNASAMLEVLEACYRNRVTASIEGLKVNFIDLPDLIKNKHASARDKDIADIKNLPPAKKTPGPQRGPRSS